MPTVNQHLLYAEGSDGRLPVEHELSLLPADLPPSGPKKGLLVNHIKEGELVDVNLALNNHMSAVLALLRDTAVEGVMNIPDSLIDPLRRKTMAALKKADAFFNHSKGMSVAENDANQLYSEEMMKKKKQQQRLGTISDEGTENEGQLENNTKLASASRNYATLPPAAPAPAPSTYKQVRSSNEKAQRGGLRRRPSAKVTRKLCSNEGCTSQARKGGVCWRHGAKKKCNIEGCTSYAKKGGVCWRHGTMKNVKKT